MRKKTFSSLIFDPKIIINLNEHTTTPPAAFYIDKMSNKLVVSDYLCVKIENLWAFILHKISLIWKRESSIPSLVVIIIIPTQMCSLSVPANTKFFSNLYQITRKKMYFQCSTKVIN